MLGSIVIFPESSKEFTAQHSLGDLLGVPVLARAIAGVTARKQATRIVVVAPSDLHDRIRKEVVGRFALDEVIAVISPTSGVGVSDAAGVLPSDCDVFAIQHAFACLVPNGAVDQLLGFVTDADVAVAGVLVDRALGVVEDGVLQGRPSATRLETMIYPVVVRRDPLFRVKAEFDDGGKDHVALIAADNGLHVVVSPGDDDNRVLTSENDFARAVEVFARRAVDFPFMFPRGTLPEDPLATLMNYEPPTKRDTERDV